MPEPRLPVPEGAERRARSTDALPAFLKHLVGADEVDRPVPSLGIGDHVAAAALLLATRTILMAVSAEEIATAVACFAVQVGGQLLPATGECATALPMDLASGTGAVVLVDAEPLSVARMRLEQFLPALLEDARVARTRLLHLRDAEESSHRDPLTGLLSRRGLMRELAGAVPGDVICLIDVDNFKSLNDSAGHRQGDRVLECLGQLLVSSLRQQDIAGRYGGDELLVLLRHIPELVAAERISSVQERWIAHRPHPVTFSAGVAAVGEPGWDEALRRADAAMYTAKRQGRNRTSTAGEGVS